MAARLDGVPARARNKYASLSLTHKPHLARTRIKGSRRPPPPHSSVRDYPRPCNVSGFKDTGTRGEAESPGENSIRNVAYAAFVRGGGAEGLDVRRRGRLARISTMSLDNQRNLNWPSSAAFRC